MMILNRHLAIKVVCINRSHEKALRLAVTNEKKSLSFHKLFKKTKL